VKLVSGQVAVVTGGASGIGYGLAQAFLDRGLNVVVSDVRADGLEEAARRLGHGPSRLATVVTDVSDMEAVSALRDETLARFGRVDVVCNNAGIVVPAASSWEQPMAAWDRLVAVKLMGVVHGIRAFAPVLIEQGSGHFLNTASVRGLVPLPDMAPYAAVMHGVVGLTVTLDAELRARGGELGATVLCPGAVVTDLRRNSALLHHGGAPVNATVAPGSAMTPKDVATMSLAAIEDDRVVLMPNEDRLSGVLEHFAMLAEQTRQPHGEGSPGVAVDSSS
jgi:NAD(P)-dependent dehydrogenase (short-subunit alcohol dehydrogenase family)